MLTKGSKVVNVGIADMQGAQSPEILRTTLGSCIGVVFYAPDKKVGAMSHFMLSKDPSGKDSQKNPFKYADTAIPLLIKKMSEMGCNHGEYSVRLFGGASMFKGVQSSFLQNIGEQNILIARAILEQSKIPLIVEDVGGHDGRTISLYLDDGRILLKKGGFEKYLYKVR
ncbi:chemotaxis protein CheD [Leptospira santarosai]|uniref:Probable chemoreceptor glutamine deamidase CheD n=1 Tax=Leptospira santarosai TaxID=28183 RepID=A0A2P1QYG6_9LEPT|nr:chemotaxis protein CheD [Leptospira santarosai]AVQ13926.1 putative chemoreceptor glutamine deamidase CheD [Leptospira santarosai]EMJ46489.1 CheD chemotactic sensory transduction [Leptospira santarosai str. HAI1349]EMO13360.1 CheD chemotactic sensory transduction [Leptospira santarosai str. CBC523]EMO21027.1 CheD chemotactic sensory transduction [Leptospira santarosai str. HAI134]EMP03878.1 CheD chemotactic sensory transduction [Leptospira santarosai str. HAI1380]